MSESMKKVKIGSMELGEGLPRIILPIAEKRALDIFSQAREFRYRPTDAVEWRADFYEDLGDKDETLKTLKKLRKLLGRIPLIFTARHSVFGGQLDTDHDTYYALQEAVIDSGMIDAIDLAIGQDTERILALIEKAHQKGIVVLGSCDDPEKTPSVDEMVGRLKSVQEYPVDVIKMAVMAQNAGDAIHLMDASYTFTSTFADRPLITIAMGPEGMITRLACEAIGTCATYGSIGEGSAPGQFQVERLQTAIKVLHQGIQQCR